MNVEVIKQLLEATVPFIARSGLTTLDIDRGYVKLKMPFEGNSNHIGTMYAGALFTLAEAPAGGLFLTSFDVAKFYPVLKEQSIRYRRPARTDVTIEVRMDEDEIARIAAEAEAEGKCEFVLEAELKDATGEVVAESRQTVQIRKHGM
jgi:acyl-coenzyme A thioesterase PaaI-like protein